jgi:hypothetical protein
MVPPLPGVQILHVIAFVGGVLPNIYMIIRVWLQGKEIEE